MARHSDNPHPDDLPSSGREQSPGNLSSDDAQKAEEQKNWLQRLNDVTSLIAAVIGILIAFQTIRLNNEIDQLNENIEASSLISDLIGSLTSEDIKQDIALLALDNALTSDPEETDTARTERHKKLVAEIAASLLNNRTLAIKEGEDAAAVNRRIQEETRTARKILERLAQEIPGPDYQQIAQAALDEYQSEGRSAESPTTQAQINYEPSDSSTTGGDDVVVPEVKTQAELTPLQREQKTLELATTAGDVAAIAENGDRIVYLHYDDPGLESNMQALKTALERQDWFVTDKIQLVRPSAFNCSVSSDIRFFHEEDETLARELRTQISETPTSGLENYVGNVRLVDLSNWAEADLVPQRQLELWVVAKTTDCQATRKAKQTQSPPTQNPENAANSQ